VGARKVHQLQGAVDGMHCASVIARNVPRVQLPVGGELGCQYCITGFDVEAGRDERCCSGGKATKANVYACIAT
jgi:hypothetical protein